MSPILSAPVFGVSNLTRLMGPVHDRLVLYAVAAAATGLMLPGVAAHLAAGVPFMLAGQVLGVALTLTVGQFATVARRPAPVVFALAVQWAVMPLLGLVLVRVIDDTNLRNGALIIAVAPAEITSALVAILAAGSGAVAVVCMACSLCLGTVLTPLWVGDVVSSATAVDKRSLVVELGLCVAAPLVIGVALRSLAPALEHLRSRALDLSAACVVLVVFVSAGSASAIVASSSLLPCLALCAALVIGGYGVGLVGAWPWRHQSDLWLGLIFPVGMREFGIAAAVALAVSPGSVGVAGVYGAMLMVSAPALARRLRIRRSVRW